MTSAQIRQSFLDFFRQKEHTIVPSSSLLPSSPNLLFTNAGMNQFVPYFLGAEKPPFNPPRVADTQKCIRAGGKHNDLDDVGLDTYHHTFFEMLGNWSFGNYFKVEAIGWAWELVVGRWKFPASRLYATVYAPVAGDPAKFDQESYDVWADLFRKAGLDPAVHVVNGGRKDNFWMMGDTGPCGPCSEMHFDLTPGGDTKGSLVNKGDARCIELWNLVFIQFNANPDGTFTRLPARHVDTGMGFERVASIMQGTRNFTDFSKPISNYDTDVFRPIFLEIERLSGKKYTGTLPAPGTTGKTDQERIDVAFRVVGDHLRTLTFAIADGIQPSNTDRGYVLRRILRRAVRYGRELGLGGKEMPGFLGDLLNSVLLELGRVFPELVVQRDRIRATLTAEEEAFARTLDKGNGLFREELARIRAAGGGQTIFPAETAFKLYDTYGFPVDLTQLMAREEGLTLDTAAVEGLMEAQRALARSTQKKEVIGATQPMETESTVETEFLGYRRDTCVGSVQEIVPDGDNVYVVVNRSTFYAEMGGQVGDTGVILGSANKPIPVVNTIQRGRAQFLRLANPADQAELPIGRVVSLEVDSPRRRSIEGHHTATHLLHFALHEVVGPEVAQRGSYVGPDRLRFDFNSAPLTREQVAKVEDLVNSYAIANEPVTWVEVPYDDVRGRPDIMQFFGDKYGDTVRVVQIGGVERRLDGFSMELCAGTHLRSTGQVGAFKITSESAISAGVRRIEAVTGQALLRYYGELAQARSERVQELEAKLADLGKAEQKGKAGAARAVAERFVEAQWPKIQDLPVPRINERVDLGDGGPDVLAAVVDLLKQRNFRGVAVLVGEWDGAAHLAITVSREFSGRYSANDLVQQLAPIIGGKGGGKADLARGAGREPGKINDLLWRSGELLA